MVIVSEFSDASIDALAAGETEFYYLVKFNFTTPFYLATTPYDVDDGVQVWDSGSILTEIPDLVESLEIKPNTINIGMAGSPLINQSLTLTENYKYKEVLIYRYIPLTEEAELGWKGFIQNYTSKEDKDKGTSTITWKCASHFYNWKAVNGRVLSNDAQQAISPGDLGLQYLGVTDAAVTDWNNQDFSQNSYVQSFRLTSIKAPGVTDVYFEVDNASSKESIVRLPVLYGEDRIEGIPFFRALDVSDKRYLYVGYLLCEGEVDSLVDIQFKDGESYTSSRLSPVVAVIDGFKNGAASQVASPTLISKFPAYWTSNHRLDGMAYVILRYKKSRELTGEPTPAFIIKGREVLDTRTNVTAWSANPALIGYDYGTNTLFGKGIPASEFPVASVNVEADYCETQVVDHDGSGSGTYAETPASINLFEFNGKIDTNKPIKGNFEHILFNMRGYIPWSAGQFEYVVEKSGETPVYTFTDDNIEGELEVTETDPEDQYNEVYYEIVDPRNGYKKAVYESRSATYLAEDQNVRSAHTVANPNEKDRYRAKNRAATIMKKSRECIRIKLKSSNAEAIKKVKKGKIVALTIDSKGWVNKYARVMLVSISAIGMLSCELEEYESSVYDWSVSVEDVRPEDTLLPDVNTIGAPGAVSMASGSTHQVTTADGSASNRILVSFVAATDPYVEGYEVQYRVVGDTNWTQLPNLTDIDDVEIYIPNVQMDQSYEARVRSFNAQGTYSLWSTVGSFHSVSGVTAVGRMQQIRGADAYENESIFWHTLFDSIDGFYTQNARYGASTREVFLDSHATLISYLRKTKNISITPATWAKNRRLKMRVRMGGLNNLGPSGMNIMVGTIGNHIGFQLTYDGADSLYPDIKAISSNTRTSHSSSVLSYVKAGDLLFEIVYTAGTKVEYYVNGVLLYTLSSDGDSSAGIPWMFPTDSGSDQDADVLLQMYIYAGGAAGAFMGIGEAIFLQEQ